MLVLLLFGAAFGVARAQEAFVERVRDAAPSVKRWGGYALIAVGAWLLLLAAFAGTFAEGFPV